MNLIGALIPEQSRPGELGFRYFPAAPLPLLVPHHHFLIFLNFPALLQHAGLKQTEPRPRQPHARLFIHFSARVRAGFDVVLHLGAMKIASNALY